MGDDNSQCRFDPFYVTMIEKFSRTDCDISSLEINLHRVKRVFSFDTRFASGPLPGLAQVLRKERVSEWFARTVGPQEVSPSQEL